MQPARHPAKYNVNFIPIFAELLRCCQRVLDPFGGVGKLTGIRDHGFHGQIFINELEPEWAAQATRSVVTVADAEHLPFLDGYFDGVATSPAYANRMADHHNAKDDSRRNTYTHVLGRSLHPANTGAMQWGPTYRDKHGRVWRECWRVLAPGGLFILNISDHIRKGEVVPVTTWHIDYLTGLGFALVEHRKIPTQRLRHGANGRLRVPYESILVFVKEDPA